MSNNSNIAVPFGILFEESALPSTEQFKPTYNEEMDISYIDTPDGVQIPFIELNRALTTQTLTKTTGEVSDPDYDQEPLVLATQTDTRTTVEAHDTDYEESISQLQWNLCKKSIEVTGTITNIKVENTDTD